VSDHNEMDPKYYKYLGLLIAVLIAALLCGIFLH
jgi:hypothetical protein